MPVPSSTYRVQVSASFDLHATAALTRYLRSLGAGAVYVSPVLQAAAGSGHGYDVVDFSRIDAARGGAAGWQAFLVAAREQGLGVLADIVPNHTGVANPARNAAWWDLLRAGRDSAYASWFDVDWSRGRILLPVLADGASADRDLAVVGDELRYGSLRFPVAPGTGGGTPAEVHDRQRYELAHWRRADTDLNYRRFFAVSSLAGLRVENPDVFDATHAEVLRWVHEDGVDGLRIDHPDGLADPGGYLDRLHAAAPDTWLLVEKILGAGEELPDWPVAGTTGYDALADVLGVLVDPSAESAFDALYRELTGDTATFDEHAAAGKRFVATGMLRSEVRRLAALAPQLSGATAALTELLVAFPLYRSYLPHGAEHLAGAIEAASAEHPELAGAIGTLTSRLADPADELATRFQQTSGAVTAKGVEDTAYYRYTRFVALNEVGCDPARFGTGLAGFHAAAAHRQRAAPDGMTTLSTHDTKRGEDVRARLAVLAEVPVEWGALARSLMAEAALPDAAFGYLLWQTFAGVGFVERARMHAYAEKAMREAAVATSWPDPDPTFEDAVHTAVDMAYDVPALHDPLARFVERITPYGWTNALSQKLIQLAMPGVPDVYQGSELWEDSLVDPDNRRPVDFAARESALAALAAPPPVDASGAAKLWITSRALRLRRDRPALFTGYVPLYATGPAREHAVAFDRGGVVAVATRLPVALERAGGWRDTMLPVPGGTDVLTGRPVPAGAPLAELLATYPVALVVTPG